MGEVDVERSGDSATETPSMTNHNLLTSRNAKQIFSTDHSTPSPSALPDLVCLSHLRWDFVYQRPQHLLTRFARERRVFFVEEPIFDAEFARMNVSRRDCGVTVMVPHLPAEQHETIAAEESQRRLINHFLAEQNIGDYLLWYYTPMALGFTDHLKGLVTVYDCMDELSAFLWAPTALREREAELLRRADLVFTGGQSLYEAKRRQRPSVYAFPSSIDKAHFARARVSSPDPADQKDIPRPRFGFFGVIDERFDKELLSEVAAARPDWHFVMVGPVVKVDPQTLPRRANVHYLGGKSYEELPAYLANWDVALLPFARNESTRFISPTKTPEYLAAGKPVISTSIRDVVRPYAESGLVSIADTAEDFVAAGEAFLAEQPSQRIDRQARADAFLAPNSWDKTWDRMSSLIEEVIDKRARPRVQIAAPVGGAKSSFARAADSTA